MRGWRDCAEHELQLLTASEGPRSAAREAKREMAELRGVVEDLLDVCGEQKADVADLRGHMHGRQAEMQDQLLADLQSEMRQGRGGLRQVVEKMVMGMDIQVDLDAVRGEATRWHAEFKAETELRVEARLEQAKSDLASHAATMGVAAAGGGGWHTVRGPLKTLDARLGKMEKHWGEERRVILKKLQQLDAITKEASTSRDVTGTVAAATAAAVARAVVREELGADPRRSPHEAPTPGSESPRLFGSALVRRYAVPALCCLQLAARSLLLVPCCSLGGARCLLSCSLLLAPCPLPLGP